MNDQRNRLSFHMLSASYFKYGQKKFFILNHPLKTSGVIITFFLGIHIDFMNILR